MFGTATSRGFPFRDSHPTVLNGRPVRISIFATAPTLFLGHPDLQPVEVPSLNALGLQGT
jgi:hypothetical protein